MTSQTVRQFAGATLLALSFSPSVVAAQTPAARFVDSARVQLERPRPSIDTAMLSRVEVMLDRALVAFPNDAYVLHYRGYAAYRRTIALIGDNPSKASAALATAMDSFSRSADKLPWPETFALLATTYGLAIRFDQSRAMELGQQIGGLQAQAMQLGPNNPRVALILGEAMANTPTEYGGGMDKAKALLTRAIALFETDKPAPLAPTWGREEAKSQLAELNGGKPR